MDKNLKKKFMKTIKEISIEEMKNPNVDEQLTNMSDIFNLATILENWEELQPDIKFMLERKAKKDKWRNCR